MTAPSEPTNERFEAVVAELADLVHSGHVWECTNPPEECPGTDCAQHAVRAVLAYLHGAGVIYWGQGRNPLPAPPEGAGNPYAVRVMAEFWHPVERTADDIENEVTRYHWLPGVLAVAAGYPSDTKPTPPRTFLDEVTEEQRVRLVPILRMLLDELAPTEASLPVGMSTLMEMADNMRARLEYDARRGVRTDPHGQWMRLGWDVGHMAGDILRAPSEAVAKVFYSPAWRPTVEELTWFRNGFVAQRKGERRPVDRG